MAAARRARNAWVHQHPQDVDPSYLKAAAQVLSAVVARLQPAISVPLSEQALIPAGLAEAVANGLPPHLPAVESLRSAARHLRDANLHAPDVIVLEILAREAERLSASAFGADHQF